MSTRNAPRLRAGVGALGALLALVPQVALADNPACADISGGDPILYGAGGSAQRPLIGKAAKVLNNGTNPIFLVYKDDAGACSGINALANLAGTTITGNAKYWDTSGAELTCTLPISGEAVDYASMGNGPLLCPLVSDISLVDGIIDVTGPISTVNILVPNASTQQGISAEAFYLVYGFGAAAGVAPWINASADYYVHRNTDSYVQNYLALATGLPSAKFYGVDAGTNGNTITLLSGLAAPDAGIGFASGEVADANRATVRTLAYQHVGQNKAYWPDSSATAFDKLNVRKGAYFLWGPGHFYALEGASAGTYLDPNARVLLEYLSGVSQPAGTTTTITDIAIANRNIPTCAMEVQRDGDLTPIYAYAPEEPCGCLFEFKATGSTSCDACDESTPCASGTCRSGYCEAY